MRRYALLLSLALVACEPAEKKAERLRARMNGDCLAVRPYLDVPEWTAEHRREQEAKCDVATRDFNAFMSGR